MVFLQIRGSLPLTTAGSQLKHPGLGRNQTHYRAGILQEALSEIWLHCESSECKFDVMGWEAG